MTFFLLNHKTATSTSATTTKIIIIIIIITINSLKKMSLVQPSYSEIALCYLCDHLCVCVSLCVRYTR